jgi:hypothetical protein
MYSCIAGDASLLQKHVFPSSDDSLRKRIVDQLPGSRLGFRGKITVFKETNLGGRYDLVKIGDMVRSMWPRMGRGTSCGAKYEYEEIQLILFPEISSLWSVDDHFQSFSINSCFAPIFCKAILILYLYFLEDLASSRCRLYFSSSLLRSRVH